MNQSQRALVIFGVFAVILVVMAAIANITNTPWLVAIAPVGYLAGQLINRRMK